MRKVMLTPVVIVMLLGVVLVMGSRHLTAPVSSTTTVSGSADQKSEVSAGSATTPQIPDVSLPTPPNNNQTTVTTSDNCTKMITSNDQSTASGDVKTSSTSVKCAGQNDGATNVSVSSNTSQTAKTGDSSSGNGGSATNNDTTDINIIDN